MNKDRRLGRGLAALLGTPLEGEQAGAPSPGDEGHSHHEDWETHVAPAEAGDGELSGAGAAAERKDEEVEGLLRLSVYEIDDNPFQPRRDFSEPEIASLAESLREHDMLQPILVRKVGERFQLISGERRLRAAIRAGWATIPARLREADDRLVAELAIVENLQRKDLNAIEKAMSFKRYLEQHNSTQEEFAQRLKLDRSTIANLMRLLELPEIVIDAIRNGKVSAGHAKALLPLGDETRQIEFSERIINEGLSVREVERQVTELIRTEDHQPLSVVSVGTAMRQRRIRARSQQIGMLEQQLRSALGTRVDVQQRGGKGAGKIVIHFHSSEEYERLHEQLTEARSDRPQTEVG